MATTEAKLYEVIAMTETAAEDLSALSKSLPQEVCDTVNQMLCKSSEVERLEKAAKFAEKVAAQLYLESRNTIKSIKRCAIIAGIIATVIPLVSCALAYHKNRKLNIENIQLIKQVQALQTMEKTLSLTNPKRLELIEYEGGEFGILLPQGINFQGTAPTEDGRKVVIIE